MTHLPVFFLCTRQFHAKGLLFVSLTAQLYPGNVPPSPREERSAARADLSLFDRYDRLQIPLRRDGPELYPEDYSYALQVDAEVLLYC